MALTSGYMAIDDKIYYLISVLSTLSGLEKCNNHSGH